MFEILLRTPRFLMPRHVRRARAHAQERVRARVHAQTCVTNQDGARVGVRFNATTHRRQTKAGKSELKSTQKTRQLEAVMRARGGLSWDGKGGKEC